MNLTEYLQSIPGLREIDRTISAQVLSPNDNGILKYSTFFPITDVLTTQVGNITIPNFRPTASRREWNGPGRAIPVQLPTTRDVFILPIESYFSLGEYEMQMLMEQSGGQEQIVFNRIGLDVPSRTDALAMANYRRVELDAMRLWATGSMEQDDPQTGQIATTSFGFEAGRQQQANTSWTGTAGSTGFYANLVSWLLDSIEKYPTAGRIGGVMLSSAAVRLLRSSAPVLTAVGIQQPKIADIESEISDELGNEFSIVVNDDTTETFANGSTQAAREVIWPQTVVAAIPVDGQIGITAKAPVVRAAQLANEFRDASIETNGMTVYYSPLNDGKGAKISCQGNMMAIPNPQKIWTMNYVQAA